jgi:hypothetical protein
VQLPIRKEVYLPILKELEEYGLFLKNKRCRFGYKPDKDFS